MKSNFTPEMNDKLLKAAAVAHLILGLVLVFFVGEAGVTRYIWQATGMAIVSLAIGYFIASSDTDKYWPIIIVGFLTKISIALILLKAFISGDVSLTVFSFCFLFALLWIALFYSILIHAYEANTLEESAPKKFNDLIKFVRTNQGITLYEMSERENILLVFVRHFGCTFCRETVSEIAKLEKSIQGKKLTPVFVHMSDPAFGDQFFAQYYTHPVAHISDPQRFLYKSLGLKRGTLLQLFGPRAWIRGLWAGVFKGHGVGAFEGDYLQLGGYFILSRGQIVFEHKNRDAAEFFELDLLPEA